MDLGCKKCLLLHYANVLICYLRYLRCVCCGAKTKTYLLKKAKANKEKADEEAIKEAWMARVGGELFIKRTGSS